MASDFDRRISQIQQNLNHAIWRFELVSGFHYDDNLGECSTEDAYSVQKEPSNASRPNFERKMGEGRSEHVLSQMLSSPESLAHLCLQKGSMLQAQQVIKVFQLEGKLHLFINFFCSSKKSWSSVHLFRLVVLRL